MNRTLVVRSLVTIRLVLLDVSFSINHSEMVRVVDLVEDVRTENVRVGTLSIPLRVGTHKIFEVSLKVLLSRLFSLSDVSLLRDSLDSRDDRGRHYRTPHHLRYHSLLLLWRKKNSRIRGTETFQESSLLFELRCTSSSNERIRWTTPNEQQWLLRTSSRRTSSSSSQSIKKIRKCMFSFILSCN